METWETTEIEQWPDTFQPSSLKVHCGYRLTFLVV